jgi:hypothetical protein
MPLLTDKSYLDADTQSLIDAVDRISEAFNSVAQRVSAYGLAEGPRRSLGMVGQMSAELLSSASELFKQERWYPGACVVRQVVEIEYVLLLFANDTLEAQKFIWLTPEQAKSYFMPAKMRERSGGRFDANEYSAHCELGGHPRKKGAVLLKDWMHVTESGADQVSLPRALWQDLAEHATRSWRTFSHAVLEISPSNVYPEVISRVEIAITGCAPLQRMRT